MIEIVEAQQIMLAAMAGALVVLFGAMHALFLALAKLGNSRAFMWVSYAAYGLFFCSAMVLAWTLHLTGFWFLVVSCMLLGYLAAPYAIWHLSVATHGAEDESVRFADPTKNAGDIDHE